MAINLELKIQVKSHSSYTKKLKLIKAKYCGMLNQKDIYYKFHGDLLKLRIENGSYFLIKYLRDEKRKRWSEYHILELNGSDPEKYLSDIFSIESTVEKKRKLFLFNNTRIHLDVVKGLGYFLELETVVVKKKSDSQKEFDNVVKMLDLDLSKQIRKSYKNLLTK